MKHIDRTDDISSILKRWKYDEDKNVRRLRTENGREVLQVRLPLGVEQYEIHGRPDGLKPEGFESWLDNYVYQAKIFGREFSLDTESCERLQTEGLLYYYRYLLFFQIQEYELCLRDTSRNLRLLDFVQRHADNPEHVELLEQYRPYILRMQIMAKALLRVKEKGDIRGAVRILKTGLNEVHTLPEMAGNDVFDFEKSRSIKSLEDLLSQLEKQVPLSWQERLEKKMREAINKEDYEQAALLRDQIRLLRNQKRTTK